MQVFLENLLYQKCHAGKTSWQQTAGVNEGFYVYGHNKAGKSAKHHTCDIALFLYLRLCCPVFVFVHLVSPVSHKTVTNNPR